MFPLRFAYTWLVFLFAYVSRASQDASPDVYFLSGLLYSEYDTTPLFAIRLTAWMLVSPLLCVTLREVGLPLIRSALLPVLWIGVVGTRVGEDVPALEVAHDASACAFLLSVGALLVWMGRPREAVAWTGVAVAYAVLYLSHSIPKRALGATQYVLYARLTVVIFLLTPRRREAPPSCPW